MTTKILEYLPFDSPRTNQVIALNWLSEQDAKYLLLEVPVGGGKSGIALTYSRFLKPDSGSSYILTPQKILQDQYTNTFDAKLLASLYGKSNYSCSGRRTTCDIGSLVKPRCEYCPFRSALVNAKVGSNTVLNYKLALSLFAFTDVFYGSRRELMVLDECHTVEEHLTEFDSIDITKRRSKKFGLTEEDWPDITRTDIYKALEWVRETYLPSARRYFKELFHKVEPLLNLGDDLTKSDSKLIKEYSNLEDYIMGLSEFVLTKEETLSDEYVLVFDKTLFKFKQITGAKNFQKLLNPKAERFLFMSSTILDKDGFCQDLGLPPEETSFLSLDSDFPKENRPVFFIPRMKMTKDWDSKERKEELKEMAESVKEVCKLHPEESGIIHTANFKLSNWIVDILELWPENNHMILHHNPEFKRERGKVIRDFTNQSNDVPTILVSPSITEGLDLVDDLARFAIFLKVPFGFLGDQWIKRRQQMSREWYERRALIDIIQGGGRIVRSGEDWGNVYILDGSWGYLYSKSINKLPVWWKNAYSKI